VPGEKPGKNNLKGTNLDEKELQKQKGRYTYYVLR
jgi:hypothetical protein